MAYIKEDEIYRANYWKVFPDIKNGKAHFRLFPAGADTSNIRNSLKTIVMDIDFFSMDYDNTLPLVDAVSKYAYIKGKESKIQRIATNWDEYKQDPNIELVYEDKEMNFFVDAVDDI